MIVVTIGLGLVAFVERRDQVSADVLGDIGVSLVSTFEKSGAGALQEQARRYEKQLKGNIFIYQENGRPL